MPTTNQESHVRWGRVIAISMSGIVSHAFGRATLQTVLPAISDELELGSDIEGYLGATNFGAYFVGVIVITFVGARLAPFNLLRAGMTIVAAGLGLLVFANSVAMLFTGVFLAGLGGPGIWLSMPTLVAAEATPDRRGAVMGSLTGTMGVAFILVPVLTTLIRKLADDDGLWRPTWIMAFGFSLVLLGFLTFGFRRPELPSEERPVGMRPLFKQSAWRPAVIAYASFGFIAASYGLFLGRMLEDDAGFDRTFTTLMFTLMGFGSIAGAMGFGRLSDRLGRPRVMMIVFLLLSVSLLGLTSGTKSLVALSIFAVGSCSASIPSLIAADTRDRAGDRDFTAVFGAMTIFYGPASILGPSLGGRIGGAAGSFTAFYFLLSAMALISMGAAWRLSQN
jgi:predicted MFS family arabinose efflux permease